MMDLFRKSRTTQKRRVPIHQNSSVSEAFRPDARTGSFVTSPHKKALVDTEDEGSDITKLPSVSKEISLRLCLSPFCIILTLWVTSVASLLIGLALIIGFPTECSYDYTSYPLESAPPTAAKAINLKIEAKNCNKQSISQLKGNIYFFYELTNFFQNHRLYIFSKSWAQLRGTVFTDENQLYSCRPDITETDGRILHPCGISPRALFNDSFELFEGDGVTPLRLDESRDAITWSFFGSNFKNPSDEAIKKNSDKVWFWLQDNETEALLHSNVPGVGKGVENSHFIVWMNNEALADFRKIYGKIEATTVQLPIVVKVKNYYPVSSFSGTKKIVISETSWYGGYLLFLPITFFGVAGLLLTAAALFTYWYIQLNRSASKRRESVPDATSNVF